MGRVTLGESRPAGGVSALGGDGTDHLDGDETARDLRARNLELEVVNAVSVAVSSSLDLDAILARALDAILGMTGFAPSGGIFVLDQQAHALRLAAHRGLPAEFVAAEAVVEVGDCLCGLAAATGEIIVSDDSAHDPRHVHLALVPHAHVIVPLLAHGRVRGVLFLYPSHGVTLEPATRRLLDTIGRQIGVAIDNALLYLDTDTALQRKVVELETSLQELERRRAAAAEVQRERDHFLAMVSHDLRTPLAGMLVQTELLQRRAVADDQPKFRRIADAILAGGRRMNSMITDLVESARLAAGQLTLRTARYDAGLVIESVLDTLAPADRARVRLTQPEGRPQILADRERMARVLGNLLEHALRESPDDTPVDVILSSASGQVGITVRSRVTEAPPEAAPQVPSGAAGRAGPGNAPHGTEPGVAAQSRSGTGARPPGLDLRLHVARIFVEAQGGRIAAVRNAAEGSVVSIDLPAAPAP